MEAVPWPLAAACGTALLAAIGALWVALNKSRDETRDVGKAYQDKYEGLLTKIIELVTTSKSQTDTFTNSINTLVTSFAALKDESFKTLTAMQNALQKGDK